MSRKRSSQESGLQCKVFRSPNLPLMSRKRSSQESGLQSSNSTRSGSVASKHSPVPCFSTLIFLTRLALPPPHALEQPDQSLQSANLQGTLQAPNPHASSSSRSPQGVPKCLGLVMMSRFRSITPPPQLAEHSDHSLQSSISQWTGQSCSLHLSSLIRGGHATPVPTGCVMTFRVAVIVPPPHSAVHASSCHSETSQSVMNTFVPFMLFSSPRILSKAQISDRMPFWLSQHSFMDRAYSCDMVSCAWLCVCEPDSA